MVFRALKCPSWDAVVVIALIRSVACFPLSQYEICSVSIGLSRTSYDVMFRGRLSDHYLPTADCRLIPAHIKQWSLYVETTKVEEQLQSLRFQGDPEFVSFQTVVHCLKLVCEVTVTNVCLRSGEMRVQVMLAFGSVGDSQGEDRTDLSFFVRKRCGGVAAEEVYLRFRSEPGEDPVVVVRDGIVVPEVRTWLGVTEDYQSSYLTLSSLHPYGVSSLSLTVKDPEILTLSVAGDLQEVYTSFLELFSSYQLIDNLSEEYIAAVSSGEKVSMQQLESLMNGRKRESKSVIRVDPVDSGEVEFPPLENRQTGPITPRPSEMHITYHCHEPGVTEVSFLLELEDTFNPYEPITFSWEKTCGGFLNPYLLIGTEKFSGNILQQGVVQSAFSAGSFLVPPTEQRSVFFFSVLEGLQEVQEPTIASTGSCTAKVAGLSSHIFASDRADNATVSYACKAKGYCELTMKVDMNPPMAPYAGVQVKWRKICGGEVYGLEVYSKQAISEKKKIPDIMRNGTYVSPAPLALSQTDELVIGLSSSLPDPLPATLSLYCSESLCEPYFLDPSDSSLSLSPRPRSVLIAVNCRQSGAGKLTLSIATELFDTVDLSWTADCFLWSQSLVGLMVISLVSMAMCGGVCWLVLLALSAYGFAVFPTEAKAHEFLAEPSSALFNLYPSDDYYEYESESEVP